MKYQNECYNQLLEFVETHENWQELLKQKPYSLKAIKQCPWNSNWYMLVYNLFESELINPIVKACRGSVIDVSNPKDVKLICAPYLKFCNLGEFPDEDAKIDWSSVKISEKIDGILIKACKHNGAFYWFTNGSFELNAPVMGNSNKYVEKETDDCETFADLLAYAINKVGKTDIEIADEGSKFITKNGWADLFPEGCTLCLELVSPKNKIICDYPETKLYWHGYRNEDMTELSVSVVNKIIIDLAEQYGNCLFNIDIPKVYDPKEVTPETVKFITDAFDGSEQEGVVVCDKNWHRAKVKSDSYLHLKFMRDVDNVSDKNIFHYILTDEIDDMVTEGNRHRVEKIKEKVDNFLKQYSLFECYIKDVYVNECGENRAYFARRCSEDDLCKVRHIAFKIIDGSSAERFIKKAYGALGNFKKFEGDLTNLIFANNLWMTKDVQL